MAGFASRNNENAFQFLLRDDVKQYRHCILFINSRRWRCEYIWKISACAEMNASFRWKCYKQQTLAILSSETEVSCQHTDMCFVGDQMTRWLCNRTNRLMSSRRSWDLGNCSESRRMPCGLEANWRLTQLWHVRAELQMLAASKETHQRGKWNSIPQRWRFLSVILPANSR